MRSINWFGMVSLLLVATVIGCSGSAGDKEKGSDKAVSGSDRPQGKEEADIRANLAKLSPEDRRLAEAQQRCPVSSEILGSMGVPPKLDLEGQPVFLCCKACEKKARADVAKTVATVKELTMQSQK